MIYFKKNNEYIEKYEVTFDKEKVEELKDRIISDCSLIKHVEFCSEYGAGIKDERLVKNFRREYVGEKDCDYEVRTIYKYNFDQYVPSNLVYYISSLLDGYATSIDEIYGYDFKNDKSIDELINDAMNKFNTIDINKTYEKQKVLKEIDNLLESKRLNGGQKDIRPYYDELLSLIHFELIDTINIADIERVYSFLEKEQFEQEKINTRSRK